MNIGIYIYDNAEVLDFSGPFEVFSTAKRLGADDWNVLLISESGQAVTARGGYRVDVDHSITHHPPLDLLLVVGGVHTEELGKPRVIEWIRGQGARVPRVASVCTGAFLLAEAGLLDGCTVTTHWEDIPELERRYPSLMVLGDQRWVVSGKFVTSGGISAGIDMSLYLVSQLASQELAERTARQMEYRWEGEGG